MADHRQDARQQFGAGQGGAGGGPGFSTACRERMGWVKKPAIPFCGLFFRAAQLHVKVAGVQVQRPEHRHTRQSLAGGGQGVDVLRQLRELNW